MGARAKGARLGLWFGVGATLLAALAWLGLGAGADRSGVEPQLREAEAPAVEAPAVLEELRPRLAPSEEAVTRLRAADDLEPATAAASDPTRLQGIVLEAPDRPHADARVGLLAAVAGTPVVEPAPLTTATDPDGRFELELPDWAFAHELVVTARAEGLRPASQRLFLKRGAGVAPLTLVLERGYVLTGQVVDGGEGLANVALSIDIAFGVPGVFGIGREAFWLDGRLEEKLLRARTDQHGRFTFRGLAPHTFRVALSPPSGLRIPQQEVREVHAPAENLLIDVTPAILAVEVWQAGERLVGAEVDVLCAAGSSRFPSQMVPTLLRVPPGCEVELAVRHLLSPRLQRTVLAPPVGQRAEVRLELEAVERPSLRVGLPGAARHGVERISLRFVQRSTGVAIEVDPARTQGRDEFVVDPIGLEPGPHTLTVHTGRSGFLLPIESTVDVPRRGWFEVELAPALGGRCSVQLGSESTQDWSASYRLIDSAGQVVLERDLTHGRDFGPGGRYFVSIESVSWIAPASQVFPPGTYRLEVESDQHRRAERTVEIVAGRTTRVAVELEPKDPPR